MTTTVVSGSSDIAPQRTHQSASLICSSGRGGGAGGGGGGGLAAAASALADAIDAAAVCKYALLPRPSPPCFKLSTGSLMFEGVGGFAILGLKLGLSATETFKSCEFDTRCAAGLRTSVFGDDFVAAASASLAASQASAALNSASRMLVTSLPPAGNTRTRHASESPNPKCAHRSVVRPAISASRNACAGASKASSSVTPACPLTNSVILFATAGASCALTANRYGGVFARASNFDARPNCARPRSTTRMAALRPLLTAAEAASCAPTAMRCLCNACHSLASSHVRRASYTLNAPRV
mmetsp:Transcript_28862/g.66229  ORF Transcript_28862/g.66229 Transcript_28862/m.66229 type:complete len:297 (-) Transcript_28862:558-1448(-)